MILWWLAWKVLVIHGPPGVAVAANRRGSRGTSMGPLTLKCAYGCAGYSRGRHLVLSLVGRWVSPRLERMIGGVVA